MYVLRVQFQQVCDRLAAAVGCVIVAPDIFRGQPWTLDK
jgi:dienelactone hydrolase